jgi:hypothetical protein
MSNMFSWFAKDIARSKEPEVKKEEDPRPPIGAMFADVDDEERFIIVRKYSSDKAPEEDYHDFGKVEFFPSHHRQSMSMSLHFMNDRYKRMTPEKEQEWRDKYFNDMPAYFQREIDARKKVEQDRVDAEADGIMKSIDTADNNFVVIYCGNAISFQGCLNYAASKGFKVINTAIMPNGVFIAIVGK